MKVLVASFGAPHAWNIPAGQVEWLRGEAPDVEFLHATDEASLRAALPAAEVVFGWRLRGEHLALAPALRWVHTPNTGVRELLSPELVASPVVLTNSSGVDARPIAEHVLALTLALTRKLHVAARRQAERTWAQDELSRSPPGVLEGRTMGLVGLGHIGSEVARLATAFGMRVAAVRRRPGLGPGAGLPGVEVRGVEELGWLLEQADVLVLAAPSTPATRGLLDAAALARLRPGALLVNVARGDLVDEQALVAALSSGALGGAALDVTATEPLPADHPLWGQPSVILTPHTASLVSDDWHARAALFLANLRRFRDGQPLVNVVDKQRGY